MQTKRAVAQAVGAHLVHRGRQRRAPSAARKGELSCGVQKQKVLHAQKNISARSLYTAGQGGAHGGCVARVGAQLHHSALPV